MTIWLFDEPTKGAAPVFGVRVPDRRQHPIPDLGHFRKGLVALEQLRVVRKCCMGEDMIAAEKNKRAGI